jgi:hypothetical protein
MMPATLASIHRAAETKLKEEVVFQSLWRNFVRHGVVRDEMASHSTPPCRGRNGPREPRCRGVWNPRASALERFNHSFAVVKVVSTTTPSVERKNTVSDWCKSLNINT